MQLLVAGVVTRLESASTSELASLRAALGAGTETDGVPELVLRSECGSLRLPDRPWDQAVQQVRYWDVDDGQLVAPGPGLIALVRQGSALLDPGDAGTRGVHALLLPVLTSLFAQRGDCLIHGAAFVPESEAMLLLGGSGRGKSTLVAAALSKKWRVLSDDLLVLRLRGGDLQVSGIPQPLALPGELAHHPSVGDPIPDDPRERRNAVPEVELVADAFPVGMVVMVEHSELPGGHLNRTGARDVFGALLSSTLQGLTPGIARDVFPYALATSRLPGWHLGHAQDAKSRFDVAKARLDELRQLSDPAESAPR